MPPPGRPWTGDPGGPSAEEFERRLGSWEIDTAGSDPALANALAAAGSLRRAIPGYVIAPDDELVRRLRVELVAGAPRAERAMDDREHLTLGAAVDNPAVDNPAPIPPSTEPPPRPTPPPRRLRSRRRGVTGWPRPWLPLGSWWCWPCRC